MLNVWGESFEIIISSSGRVHLLGRVVEPSGGVSSPFEAVVFPCDADPVNEVVCVFFFPPAMVRCHRAGRERRGGVPGRYMGGWGSKSLSVLQKSNQC